MGNPPSKSVEDKVRVVLRCCVVRSRSRRPPGGRALLVCRRWAVVGNVRGGGLGGASVHCLPYL